MILSVVIPVYNEETTLSQIVDRAFLVPCEKEIIIVDDCSTDKTPQTINELKKRHGDIIKAFGHELLPLPQTTSRFPCNNLLPRGTGPSTSNYI